MEILEFTSLDYDQMFPSRHHVFNSGKFNQLNSYKCEQVKYLVFSEAGKHRLGLICGIKNNILYSPFSAPFGGFSFNKDDLKLSYYINAVKSIEEYVLRNNYQEIIVVLPPSIYARDHISKQIHSFYYNDYKVDKLDLNFQYDLADFTNDYDKKIWHNARKNLHIAQKAELKFRICSSDYEKKLAYQIIQENRSAKGYPLRMTQEQVIETSKIIDIDYFLVNKNEMPIAAAIVFHVNEEAVQVVYWGDKPGFSDYKPMNYLSYCVFEFYKQNNFKFIDIGPATENSVPNYGLCEFKESIGCSLLPKFTFKKKFR